VRLLTIALSKVELDAERQGLSVVEKADAHRDENEGLLALSLSAIAILRENHGPTHTITILQIGRHAACVSFLGRYAQAIPLFEKVSKPLPYSYLVPLTIFPTPFLWNHTVATDHPPCDTGRHAL